MTAYGALTFPAGSFDAVTDPVLTHLPGFLEAALTERLSQAWQAVASTPIVKRSFAHDPEICDVSDKDFPALFVWRAPSGPAERISEDRVDFRSRINVLWVFAPEKQLKLNKQLPIFNGIEKAIFDALDTGRTKTWKVPGDTDLSAPSKGSLLSKYTGADFKGVLSANPDAGVTVELTHGGKLETYPALLFALDMLETAPRAPGADEYAPHRNTATVNLPAPDQITVRLIALDKPPTPP